MVAWCGLDVFVSSYVVWHYLLTLVTFAFKVPSKRSSVSRGIRMPRMSTSWLNSAFRSWLRGGDREPWAALVLSFLVLCFISFIMLWLGDKLSGQGAAVTRYMARVQAPLAARFYPDAARQKVTVITYDDQFLQSINGAWPISYAEHADWLLRLVADPQARPKAIFIDITFSQERDDVGVDELSDALCLIQQGYGVPIFLAALASRIDGHLYVRSGLQSKMDGEQSCFTLVGVRHTPDPVDGMTWSYPLTSYAQGGAWQSGPSPDADTPAFRSAAMAMAQDVAGIDLGNEREPLALVWGASSTPQDPLPESLKDCRLGGSVLSQLLSRVLPLMAGDTSSNPSCPFHPTLSMSQIADMEEAELSPYLDGTYLIVGAAIDGQNDFAMSPVHGLIPGLHVHAMALDNLLVYRDNYKRHSQWGFPPSLGLFIAGLVAIASIFAVHIGFKRVRVRLSAWVPNRFMELNAAQPLWWRCLMLLLRFVLWLLRLWVQLIVAMLLIVFLQTFFRIGMLPVVELAGMTVLAEGLDYLGKIRVFFAGARSSSSNVPTS